jgi:hypothetical protein
LGSEAELRGHDHSALYSNKTAEGKKQRKEKEGKGSNISTSLTTNFKLGQPKEKEAGGHKAPTSPPPPL